MSIEDSNRLIAAFIEVETKKYKSTILYNHDLCAEPVEACFLSYNESWDWIMPVVEKILDREESSDFVLSINGSVFYAHFTSIEENGGRGKSRIQATYRIVCKAIEKYI